ncbi:MAG: (2,3-dihydroxybenzoyl)adenylate synthase [Desulfobacteraceae bacterium]|nr:MAG: (2,3-dihydroxybenzoyl)adenylate synthase [Desulfobacteraceae bacterium]
MLEGFVGWPKEFVDKYRQAGYWQEHPLGDIVDDAVKEVPDRVAISFEGKHITYREMGQKVDRLALHLLDMGHKPMDRLILQLPNVPETIYLYFAAVKIGVIPIMTLPAHRQAEIGYFAQFADATSYAIPKEFRRFDYIKMAQAIRSQTPSLKHILVLGDDIPAGMISVSRLLEDPIEKRLEAERILKEVRPNPLWPAVFQLSGGTTGIPKLIPRTHNDYYYNSLRCKELSGCGRDTSYLIAIPITHNFSTTSPGFQGVFMAGGKVVIAPSPVPNVVLPLIESERVTTIPAVPTMIISYMSDSDLKHYDLSSLELCQVGGSRLLPEVAQEIGPRLGADLQQVLGMAEGPNFFTRLDDPEEVKFYTQGRSISPGDEIEIVNGDGKEVPPGEVGELLVRGPYTIRGYFNFPEHNVVAFTSDGFYKSGDLVRMHPSGNLIVEGRIKDTINRGGEKISAEEMENHILAHPKLLNCAYVAMPDPLLGEKPCLFAVAKGGETFSLKELSDFLVNERKIAKYKLPERLEFLEQLPLTHVGKVNKKELRRIIAERLKEEGKN